MRNKSAAAVVFAVALASASQVTAHPKWQYGLKGGLAISQLRGSGQAGVWLSGPDYNVSATLLDNATGFEGGGYGRMQIGKSFALQLEALYSNKGGQGIINGNADVTADNNIVYNAGIEGEAWLDLDYLEFPIIAAFTLPTSDKVSFVPYVGYSAGFLLQANAHFNGNAAIPLSDGSTRAQTFSQAYDVQKSISSYDGEALLGVSLEWLTTHGRFLLDMRYGLSIRTIDSSEEKSIHNSVFSLMLGFGWGRGAEVE